jgi:transposase
MVYKKISTDLKEAMIRLDGLGDYDEATMKYVSGFSTRTLRRAKRRYRLTGSAAPPASVGRGRPRKLTRTDGDYLVQLSRHKPSLFLDEYARRLERFRHLPVHISTIHRTLRRAGLSLKRIQKLARERDPQKRADFVRRIGQYPPNYLISIDEVSKDDRTYARLWGRAPQGEPAEESNPFTRKRRFSMVAAMVLDEGIIAARVREGSFAHQSFYEYLRDDVVRGPGC